MNIYAINDTQVITKSRAHNPTIKKKKVKKHTLEPANGAATRTTPNCRLTGNSSARTIHPDVPIEIAKRLKWRSFPLSNAILQGTASTAYSNSQSNHEILDCMTRTIKISQQE